MSTLWCRGRLRSTGGPGTARSQIVNNAVMDRFAAMQIFVKVADTGSFTAAAAALDLPKGSVSQQVSRLEAHLGVRLLQRSTRRVRLTDDGAAYYARVRALLDDLGELEGGLVDAGRRPRGRLRIDVPAAFAVLWLVPALPDFHARYPDIRIEVGSSDRPVDLIAEGVDCVIRGGDVYDESLVGRPLDRLELFTLASVDYLRARGTPTHPAELREHALVGYFSTVDGGLSSYRFERGDERVALDGPFAASFNDANAYLAAGKAGLGVFQVPAGPWIHDLLATGHVERILADWSAGWLVHTVLYPSRRQLPARVQVFVDWAIERFGRPSDVDRTTAG
jgi:LysR family transcriptional regulator, regulator for bpeEF and oprC